MAQFKWNPEEFGETKVYRYRCESFNQLTLKQKQLVYYLSEAALSGRDITYMQHHRFSLDIRDALVAVVEDKGEKESDDYKQLVVYLKQFLMGNGPYNHYSSDKIAPAFSCEFFVARLKELDRSLADDVLEMIFNKDFEPKGSVQSGDDIVLQSGGNFYAPGITTKEVEEFHASYPQMENRPEHGINVRVERDANGKLCENVIKSGGLYGKYVDKIIFWLNKAATVAENEQQEKALKKLIEYFTTGDVQKWSEFSIEWVKASGDVDFILGHVEIYEDPMAIHGTFEGMVQITDFEASKRMAVLSGNAEWFEKNSSVLPEHKKDNVTGITFRIVDVCCLAGSCSPSPPIGVNLPNLDWIREQHGSKSVSLGNILEGYTEGRKANPKASMLNEFFSDQEKIERMKEYGGVAQKVHVALHEVLGHASGKMEPGKDYKDLGGDYSCLEEARADLFALYYTLDPKLAELKVIEDPMKEGAAEYDSYITSALMMQLFRIKPGKDIEEAHQRNRYLIAQWVLEKGAPENVIEKIVKDGKTYFNITDYQKLRLLFGDLLREVQRIKSQADVPALKALVGTYAVKVDQEIHKEVLERVSKLDVKPSTLFVSPQIVPNEDLSELKIEYPDDYLAQQLGYIKRYNGQ